MPSGAFFIEHPLCAKYCVYPEPHFTKKTDTQEIQLLSTGSCEHVKSSIQWFLSISVCHFKWLPATVNSEKSLYSLVRRAPLPSQIPSVFHSHRTQAAFRPLCSDFLWCLILTPTCSLRVPDFFFKQPCWKTGATLESEGQRRWGALVLWFLN